jgi:hypothetical protein
VYFVNFKCAVNGVDLLFGERIKIEMLFANSSFASEMVKFHLFECICLRFAILLWLDKTWILFEQRVELIETMM